MAEERDLKERLLKIARERNIAESVANGIAACLSDDKAKLADFMKAYEFFQNLEKDADRDGGVPDGLESADFSTYTDEELRGLLAKLERTLQETESDGVPEIPSAYPETALARPDTERGGINVRLEDYLNG